jgi:IS5 family transposase
MRPRIQEPQKQQELFKVELERLVNPEHPLVKLGNQIDWTAFDKLLNPTYHETQGAPPGINTRLMVALHYLKFQHDLSDEAVVALWAENFCWQHFSGMQFCENEVPVSASSLCRWRQRLGEAGAELMLNPDSAIGFGWISQGL